MRKNFFKSNKGFTLAELLIVVAIIAVLVAVAIPVFSTQLEKSRDATTVANLRSAYAEATTAYLSDGTNSTKVRFESLSKVDGLTGSDALAWYNDATKTNFNLSEPGTYTLTVTFDDSAKGYSEIVIDIP